ncbi:hypothetical protein FACS1894205_7520 [Alphaproteobacteria bacterium]|nr:hypothetical protein FACS1894205_7520 [Alphaproteobacteria bacterium]
MSWLKISASGAALALLLALGGCVQDMYYDDDSYDREYRSYQQERSHRLERERVANQIERSRLERERLAWEREQTIRLRQLQQNRPPPQHAQPPVRHNPPQHAQPPPVTPPSA